jgi:hypothetical protein
MIELTPRNVYRICSVFHWAQVRCLLYRLGTICACLGTICASEVHDVSLSSARLHSILVNVSNVTRHCVSVIFNSVIMQCQNKKPILTEPCF